MSKTGRGEDNHKGKRNTARFIEIILEIVVGIPGFVIRPVSDAFDQTRRILVRKFRDIFFSSRVWDTRDQLYEQGLKMLRDAQENITVVSTMPEEGLPFNPCKSVADPQVRDYFIELHTIAYRNLLNSDGRKETRLIRHTNLLDPNKWHEAFSLLYYGKGVEIWNSSLPVEFLTVDEESVLIGFPSLEGALSNGISLYKAKNCKAMVNWVESHDSRSDVFRTPGELAEQVKQLMNETNKKADESCLFHIADKVPSMSAPSKCCAEQFDRISRWYPDLYEADEINRKRFYGELADQLTGVYKLPGRFSFLDIGCGPAFGARELIDKGVQYYGMDVSEKMIGLASKDKIENIYHCDAIGALMGIDPSAGDFRRKIGTKKFNVIACQGNTFDLFLGPVQKSLALFLFDRYLENKGVLLFTGDMFSENELIVPRALRSGTMHYELEWYNKQYFKINVMIDGKKDSEVMHHQTSLGWLTRFLGYLGYEKVNDDYGIRGFNPSGGQRLYYVWIFQRKA